MDKDKVLTCKDCGENFTFTAGEQDFFAKKGFSQPVRCVKCRRAKKAQQFQRR